MMNEMRSTSVRRLAATRSRSVLRTAQRSALVAIILTFAANVAAQAPPAAKKYPPDDIIVERDVAVPMRDGTILRANVFRPATGGPYPVLLTRTPYGKKAAVDNVLVRAGFIVVTQDARGRYASDGEFESLVRENTHDGVDGYDTVEWAAKLPGSSGKVGLFGTSYPGFLSWRAAGTQPPSLVAMSACSIPPTMTEIEGPGTIRPGRRLKWWYGTISPDLRRKTGGLEPHTNAEAVKMWDAGEGANFLMTVPWSNLPDDIFFAGEAPHVKAWLREPWRDPWQLDRDAARTLVPNLNVCGWYDHCNGSIDLHTAIVKSGGSEAARKHSRLVIGPWSHSGLGKRKQGDIDFGAEAALDIEALQQKWFAHWLRGEASDIESWPAVRLFVMGAGEWRDFAEWPPRETKPREWFLSSTGAANTPAGNGTLVDEPSSIDCRDQYDYDPRDPVPTLWTPAMFTIPADQKPLAERRDILIYQTPPLDAPLETIGYPEVVLYAESTAPDTDFFVRLIDVSPNGRATDIASGMVRARHRTSLEKTELLTPGETTEFRIRMRPTAHRFLPGHRLRLDVTSSDFPNYDRNHNTAADQNTDAVLAVARQTVRHGKMHPSRLILPVMPE